MTAKWLGGHTYTPGSLVIPTTSGAVQQIQPDNPGFETGDLTGWTTADPGRWIVGANKYEGSFGVRVSGNGQTSMASDTKPTIQVGQNVSVTAKASITNAGTDDAHFQVVLQFFDAGGALLPGFIVGNEIQGKGGSWKISTASGAAPPGAATFNISLSCNPGAHGSVVDIDAIAYVYAFAPPNPGIVYKATQAAAAKSASTEPNWPGVVGVPIVDGGVTWEGELATRVVWTAHPLAKSGDTEPDWPTDNGGAVHDGTIDWIAQTPQITDPNCPHSKIVQIAASKIYAADNDIIRYCATVNPLDWSTKNDAGYLPYGLQTYGSNPCAVMSLYRSNIAAFNAEGFQNWQVDEDPANTTLLDALPIATTWNAAAAPTATDLFFLSSKGFRSVGIAATGVSLQNGDVGMPIDVLVQAALARSIANNDPPVSTYIPAEAQFWGSFGDNYVDGVATTAEVFVYTLNKPGAPGKWSRYLFPFRIDDFTQRSDHLYMRSGNGVMRVEPGVMVDMQGATGEGGFIETPFDGVVQWPWLDMGSPGVVKQFIGFDIIGSGTPTIDVGYDQSNLSAFTTPFDVSPDTVPGMIVPLPMMAPSFSFRATYKGGDSGQKWQLQAVNLYFQDMRKTA